MNILSSMPSFDFSHEALAPHLLPRLIAVVHEPLPFLSKAVRALQTNPQCPYYSKLILLSPQLFLYLFV